MKKALLSIALLFGLASAIPADAQRAVMVATSEGTAAATLEELATLAENGTPVMLWNNGRSRYIENSPNANGELMLALYTEFQAGNVSTNSQLWRLEKAEGENNYHFISLVDNKYMHMSGGSPALCTTVSVDEGAHETFTISVSDASAQTFNFVGVNASAERGETLYLNGDGAGSGHDAATVVGWNSAGGNSDYKVMVPTVEEQNLYTVNYTYTFYDGNSQTLLADAGLTDLLPTEETGSSTEVQLGDTIALPSFSNTVIRTTTMGGALVTDSTTYCLTEEMIAAGTPTLAISYTVNPRITFNCSMDLSEINGAEGEYIFDNGETVTTLTARFAVGDTIVPPAITNFTALTGYNNETATVSATKDAVYRPWRQINLVCNYLMNGMPSTIRNVSVYADIDSTITIPDLGEMFSFDQALTTENGGPEMPMTITPENIYNGIQYELYYTRNLPIKLSELNDDFTLNEETATWYILRIRGNKIFTDTYDETNNALACLADAPIDDHTLWALAEAPDGSSALLLYNKANPGKVFCDNSGGLNPPQLVDITGAEVGFDLVNTTQDGYGIRITTMYATSENMLLGDLGQANYLDYWDDARAWDDPGCTVTFEEYKASNYTFLTGRSYLNAQDCIGGFTAEQLADIRGYIEESDLSMEAEVDIVCNEELRYEENRVEYIDGDVYAILSGASQYIQRDNVKMGLYVSEDSILSWKEFDPTDKRFFFQLRDREVLTDANGQDSIVFALYNVGADGYIWGNFEFGGNVRLAEQYDIATDRFEAAPVAEVTNAETGVVTRSYVPAGFYIQRMRPSDWEDPTSSQNLVTFCMHLGAVDNTTEGTVTSYNTHENPYANVFRFFHVGTPAEVGIGSVVTDKAAGEGADKLYDLSGRQLQHEPTKGVYIKNGKAVLR